MNIRAVNNVFKFHFKTKLVSFLLMACSIYLAGTLLLALVMIFAKPDTYINLSSLLATSGLVCTLIYYSITSFSVDYNNLVKFGIARRNFLIATLSFFILICVLLMAIISILARFEVWINNLLYSKTATLEAGFEKFIINNELTLLLGALVIVISCIILAVVTIKYGGKGMLVMYVLFIGAFALVRPGVVKLYEQKSNVITIRFLEPISEFINGINPVSKGSIVLVIALIALTISLVYLSRHDVTA